MFCVLLSQRVVSALYGICSYCHEMRLHCYFLLSKARFFPFKGSINCELHLPTELSTVEKPLKFKLSAKTRKHPLWSSESHKYRLLFSVCLFFFLLPCFVLLCLLICFVVVFLIYLNNCYLIKRNTNKLCSNQVILFSQFWR